MIGFLALFIIMGIIGAIYWGIWHGTREKLEREDEKFNFLESKFSYLKNIKFDDNFSHPANIKIAECIKILNKNGFKKGKINDVIVSLPYNSKKPWKVFVSVKSGTWPINDKEEDIEIHTVLDSELNQLIDKDSGQNQLIDK